MLAILAIDQSMSRAGFCLPDGSTTKLEAKGTAGLSGMAEQLHRYTRQCLVRDRMLQLAAEHQADLIVIEGYAYNQPNAAVPAGELGFALRCGAHSSGIPWVIVPPNSRAKYATGKGNASKDVVLQHTAARLGRAFANSDECDAWLLAAMAAAAYGSPRWDVPKSHQDALTGVDWPEVVKRCGTVAAPVVTYKPPPAKKGKR